MPSVDTNIVARWLVRDDVDQAKLADKLLNRGTSLYLSTAVFMELSYVLASAYEMPREMIIEHFRSILSSGYFEFNEPIIVLALNQYEVWPKLSFVDCLITAEAELLAKKPLYTFDKKLAAQLDQAKLLK